MTIPIVESALGQAINKRTAERLAAAIGVASNGGKVEAVTMLTYVSEVTGENLARLIQLAANSKRVYRETAPDTIREPDDTMKDERTSDHARY